MVRNGFKVGSLTYAMKGRDLLLKNGYNAFITRNPHPKDDEGCGYVILVKNIDIRCEDILRKGGVNIKGKVKLEG